MKIFNDKALTEHLEKEARFYQPYSDYRPNYYKSPLTSKFYSKYEMLDLSQADAELVSTITMHRDKGPKDKFLWPATENQVYGWFNTLFVPLKKDDERFYFGMKESEMMRHGLKMMADRSMKLDKFTGIPFKLQ